METIHPLPFHIGRALKNELQVANQLHMAAQAKATTNKMLSDAILRDAGFEPNDYLEYRLHEDNDGGIGLVLKEKENKDGMA